MTMPDHEVLSEIARLEGQVAALQRELAALRRRVEGPQRRATRAFSVTPSRQEPVVPSDPTVPAFASPPTPEPLPAPSPSEPLVSQTLPSGSRRAFAPSLGLTEPPPPQSLTPSRRNALPDPNGGRYFVGDERKRQR